MREGEGSSPFFSPDSKWLGFWANGSIWKMRVDGTQHEPICDAPNQLRGASWGDDNRIVFTDGADGALRRVPGRQGNTDGPDQSHRGRQNVLLPARPAGQ